jgi:hypothetical protein
VTTRVARWSAPVGEHSVSERPRLTVSRPERARRRSTVDVTNGFGGHALPVLASGYLSRPVRSAGGPLRSSSSSPPVRRVVGGGRAPASDGESTGGRRASAAPRVSVGVVRRRPCEVQRVARARLDRPRSGWRASCCFGCATGGRPGVVFQFPFITRTGTFKNARGPCVRSRRRLRTTNR